MLIEDALSSRWKWDDVPSLQPAKPALSRALDAHTRFRAKAAELASDPNRTALGRQEALRKFVGENAHELVRARKTAEMMHVKAAERRANCIRCRTRPAQHFGLKCGNCCEVQKSASECVICSTQTRT